MAMSKRFPRGGLNVSTSRISRGGRRKSVAISRGNTATRNYVTASGAAKVIRPPRTALRRMTGKGAGNVSNF